MRGTPSTQQARRRRPGSRDQVPVHPPAVRFLRQRGGLSGRDLAERIGITPSYVSKIENGHFTSVSPRVFVRLCQTFGLDDGTSALLRATPCLDDQAAI